MTENTVDEKKEKIKQMFWMVKTASGHTKMELRRAASTPNRMTLSQQIIYQQLMEGWSEKEKELYKEFFLKMFAFYVKQDCKRGMPFENFLYKRYRSSDAQNSEKKKIEMIIDQQNTILFLRAITGYIQTYKGDTAIDFEKLALDCYKWTKYMKMNKRSYVRDNWIRVIAGTKSSEYAASKDDDEDTED